MQSFSFLYKLTQKFPIWQQDHDKWVERFSQKFFSRPGHEWITRNNFLLRVFQSFFQHLDLESLLFLSYSNGLIIIPSNGKLSCAVHSRQEYVIIVFPEMMKLLKSAVPNYGLAILAHELGHIVLNHSQRNLELLASQKESDLFAMKLGYGFELLQLLEDHLHIEECKLRHQFLQQKLGLQQQS